VAAGGRLGTPWRARRRATRKGTEPGLGSGRHVEEGEAGGGAAARGGSAPSAGETEQDSTCPRKKKTGGSGGPVWKFQEFQGPLGKERFPTDLEV
jgi:hypothetical protein